MDFILGFIGYYDVIILLDSLYHFRTEIIAFICIEKGNGMMSAVTSKEHTYVQVFIMVTRHVQN